jgi:hypothetical protein
VDHMPDEKPERPDFRGSAAIDAAFSEEPARA